VFAVWEFFYFGYSWAASGRTFGMAVLGVRVVCADGGALDPWRGAVRTLMFPLSLLFSASRVKCGSEEGKHPQRVKQHAPTGAIV
jgi:uncharacterized RDD family membrane protein YckC